MTRHGFGRLLTGATAVGFFATAWLHSTGFDSIVEVARSGPAEMEMLMPALWLSFSFDLIVLGLVVAAVAWRPTPVGRVILVIAGLGPLAAAALQLRFIGFVPPTAILIALGGASLLAAAVLEGEPGPAVRLG